MSPVQEISFESRNKIYILDFISHKASKEFLIKRQYENSTPGTHTIQGILVWGKCNSTISRNCIFIKRGIRIVNNAAYYNHTEPLLKTSEIFKLSDMYEYQVYLFMKEFISKRLPHSRDGMFCFKSDIQDDHWKR